MSIPQERPIEANDFLGKTITSGCTICYPVRRGSAMWMKKLVIKAVRDTPRGPCIYGDNQAGRHICIYNLDNCVVVETK